MANNEYLLEVNNLKKHFPIKAGLFGRVVIPLPDIGGGLLQLLLEDGQNIRRLTDTEDRHLVCQQKAVPWMALHQSAFDRPFGIAHMIGIGRVKIGVPLFQKMVHHPLDLKQIDPLVAAVQHGQPHEAEPQFLCVLRKKRHIIPPFCKIVQKMRSIVKNRAVFS